MSKYLLSVHTVEGDVREPMTDDEMRQSHEQLGTLEREMKSAVVIARLLDGAVRISEAEA